MRIFELIKKLNEYDQESEVFIINDRLEGDKFNRISVIEDVEEFISFPEDFVAIVPGDKPKQKEKFEYGDKVMVSDDHTNWRKAVFVIYDPDNNGYCYRVCTPNGIQCFQHCKKGWDEG